MTNRRLQIILNQLSPDLEVVAFSSGRKKLSKVTEVYVGNEKFLPGADKSRNTPDKIVIHYE